MENIIYQTLGTILVAAFTVQEHRLKQELKTEFMAEKVAKNLLNEEEWKKRSFTEIKKRLGGFAEDELRKIIVRSESKDNNEELCGLISHQKLSINQI